MTSMESPSRARAGSGRVSVAAEHARALALAESGQIEEAADVLRAALCGDIDPEPLNDLAVLQNSCGHADEARDLLCALVRLYPEYGAATENLAALEADTAAPADTAPGGMAYYAKEYDDPAACPADREIARYLDRHEPHDGGLTVFHFGTGAHHHVGLANHRREHPHRVIGITASPGEYQRYIELCQQDGSLGRDYLVSFGDVYNLGPEFLPPLDVASMPHLGEYYDPGRAAEPGVAAAGANTDRSLYAPLDDRSLAALIVDKLVIGGRLLIYVQSHGAAVTRELLHELVNEQRRLRYRLMHESIAVFTKVR